MSNLWEERKRPLRLERRFEFENYTLLRNFLDSTAEISEKIDYFPNIGFGRDYVNITIYADENQDEISSIQLEYAKSVDALVAEN
ncbi:MAG: 4a-hydroxytetrahydrobiopterin dehydratase [Gammaproteobacteria bacterium]|nr:4a-hydroxytetrahydrobiopterin dehydratase [Gammaproteobacteria bacterium]